MRDVSKTMSLELYMKPKKKAAVEDEDRDDYGYSWPELIPDVGEVDRSLRRYASLELEEYRKARTMKSMPCYQ